MKNEFYNDVISLDELCERLMIGKTTAYTLLQTGQIRAFKIGRIWKIPFESISEYVLSQSNHVSNTNHS